LSEESNRISQLEANKGESAIKPKSRSVVRFVMFSELSAFCDNKSAPKILE
jgi:hypothetical protein